MWRPVFMTPAYSSSIAGEQDSERRLLPVTLLILGGGAVVGALIGGADSVVPTATVLLTIPCALVLVAKLEWGLLALVFMTYTNFSDVMIKYHGAPSITDAFVPLLALILLYRWMAYGERPVAVGGTIILVMAFGLFSATSMFYARDIGLVAARLELYAKDAAIAILTVLLMKGGVTLRRAVWTLMLALIFLGSIGVFKYYVGWLDYEFEGFARTKFGSIAQGNPGYRLSGPIHDPNYFAATLVFALPLAVDRCLHERRWMLRCLAGWAVIVCLLSILFTASRGALVALGVVAVTVMILARRRRWYLALLATPLAVVVVAVLPPEYVARAEAMLALLPGIGGESAVADGAIRGRLAAWAVAWAIFLDHPLIGVGLAQYEPNFQDYTLEMGLPPRGEERQAHSLYLEIAAERGLVGLLVFLSILAVASLNVLRARTSLYHAGRVDIARIVTAFGIGWLAFLSALTFLHDAYPRFFLMMLTLALAMPQIVAHYELSAQSPRPGNSLEDDMACGGLNGS